MAADDGGPRETEGPEPGVAYGSHLASSLPDHPQASCPFTQGRAHRT